MERALARPVQYRTKPITRMVFGWTATGSTSQTLTIQTRDLLAAVASPNAQYTAAVATMIPAFSMCRLRKAEAWELNGNSITISPTNTSVAGGYCTGPDEVVTDTGTTAIPSHVEWSPKRGSFADMWFSNIGGASTNIVTFTANKIVNNVDWLVRCHCDVVLADANDGNGALTTSAANTVLGGRLYFRILVSGLNFLPEGSPEVATYFA